MTVSHTEYVRLVWLCTLTCWFEVHNSYLTSCLWVSGMEMSCNNHNNDELVSGRPCFVITVWLTSGFFPLRKQACIYTTSALLLPRRMRQWTANTLFSSKAFWDTEKEREVTRAALISPTLSFLPFIRNSGAFLPGRLVTCQYKGWHSDYKALKGGEAVRGE